MTENHSAAREVAERIVDRLQDFFHVASGPNEDGTHSGFIVVDFEEADVVMGGDGAPAGSVALLPFDLSDEDEPAEITTADDGEAAADAAEMMLGVLLELIEAVIADELSGEG